MKYLLLQLLLLFYITTTYIACVSSNNNSLVTTENNTSSTTYEPLSKNSTSNTTYEHLSKDKSIKNYVDQQIWFEGIETMDVYQHMMKSSFSLEGETTEKHLYVNYNNESQIVIYYQNIKIPQDQKKHKFYGTARKISGAGKGGGIHTEYYLDLDKVE